MIVSIIDINNFTFMKFNRNPKWGSVLKMNGVDPLSSTACFCQILSYS